MCYNKVHTIVRRGRRRRTFMKKIRLGVIGLGCRGSTLLGTILAAYRDLDERLCLVEAKLSTLEMVRRASLLKLGRFTKQDIRELCPSLSDSSIEGAFRHLVASGELQREGRGKSTRYFRTN